MDDAISLKKLFALPVLLLFLVVCGGAADTPGASPAAGTSAPSPPTALAATATPPAATQVPAPTATPDSSRPGLTPVAVPPSLSRIEPPAAAPGEEVQVEGSGGLIELRTEGGGVTGYDESARSFTLFLDGEPIGSIGCYVNTCRGTFTVPVDAVPGGHEISVGGGSSRAFAVKEAPVTLIISTGAFASGEAIPLRYACDGEDISPALSWTAGPPGTETFAIIVDDPDAPGGTWVHWVVFNIPADRLEMGEDQPKSPELPGGGIQGSNSWGDIGYGGPCPPPGPDHTYRFFLFALDRSLDLPSGASSGEVFDAMSGNILEGTSISGTYER